MLGITIIIIIIFIILATMRLEVPSDEILPWKSHQLVADHATRTGRRSALTSQYILPRLRTIFGERAFSFSGPKAWNSLPDRFHSIESTVS